MHSSCASALHPRYSQPIFRQPAPIPPPVYAVPVYNWTGLYIGGNIGAAWSGLSGSDFSDTMGSTYGAEPTFSSWAAARSA